jgi:hypothetical protein
VFAVVNHLHLNVPVSDLIASVQNEGFELLSHNKGFIASHLVQTAEDRCIVILLWETAEDAQHGARTFGPTWFNDHIIPRLAGEQQRSTGPVVATKSQ